MNVGMLGLTLGCGGVAWLGRMVEGDIYVGLAVMVGVAYLVLAGKKEEGERGVRG